MDEEYWLEQKKIAEEKRRLLIEKKNKKTLVFKVPSLGN